MGIEGIKTIDNMDFRKKKVFLRVDYNVPLDEFGNIKDDFRIRASLPTIKKLFEKGATQIIIASHLGRPQNKESKFKLDKVARRLFELTKRKYVKLDDCINLKAQHIDIPKPKDASIVILENLRFHEEEEINGADFAKELASYADVYVNDAFGVCHREHASVHAITKYIDGCIGLLVEKEIKAFESIKENPKRPMIAVLGGAKLETKLPMIQQLLHNVDKILLGGAMIFTFYKAKGYSVGKSLVDKDSLSMAHMMSNNEKIVLPIDVTIADDKDNPTQVMDYSPKNIPSYMMGLDLGRKTIDLFKQELGLAKTVIWNGPLGYYENKAFLKSTVELLKFLAQRPDIKTIIGGGDSVSIVEALGLREKYYHVSTGGGASMNLLEGKPLPALEALKKRR